MIDSGFFNNASILIVDDEKSVLNALERQLNYEGFDVHCVTSGREALRWVRTNSPDVVLLDVYMPAMDGYEVCRRIKEIGHLEDTPILFISGQTDTFDMLRAFSAGGVDYITKPIEIAELMVRINTHLKLFRLQKEQLQRNMDLQELVDRKVEQITNAQMGTILALAKLAESRDEDTGMHLDRVKVYCRVLAYDAMYKHPDALNMNIIKHLEYGSALHDIGKVAIPDSILLKPGRHTFEEFEIMKKHTTYGANTLKEVLSLDPGNRFINMGLQIAESHHEKWDGSGYPNGLRESQIPLAGRIMAIADVYDALRSKRCYKPSFSHERSCSIIQKDSGTHFDPHLVEIFVKNADRFNDIWEDLAETPSIIPFT